MLIWILAVVLLAVAAACGYKLGVVQFAVSLVGLVLGAALAVPLGPYLNSVVKLLGIKSPVWEPVVPALIVFFLIYLVFIGLSIFASQKVQLYFKYKADDGDRIRWERASHAMGLWVGLVTGAVWLLVIGVFVYFAGYLAAQVNSDQTTSTVVKMLAQGREEMHSTGLDQAVAPFDPMPARYYEAVDILGLIYQNPILVGRLSLYPPFLLMSDRAEFQEIAKDTEFNQMLLSKGDALDIWKNPKIQAVVQSPEILQELLGQDLRDLRAFLETGISPKFQDEKILGKWKLDPYSSMAQARKKHPDMSSTEMRRLKVIMTEIMPSVSLVATTDKKVTLKAEGVNEKLTQLLNPPAPKPAAVAPEGGAPQGMPQAVAQRYGITRGQVRPAQAVAAPVAAPKTNAIPYAIASSQGVWERDGDKYQLKMTDDKGKSESVDANADEDRLTVFLPNSNLVFVKAD